MILPFIFGLLLLLGLLLTSLTSEMCSLANLTHSIQGAFHAEEEVLNKLVKFQNNELKKKEEKEKSASTSTTSSKDSTKPPSIHRFQQKGPHTSRAKLNLQPLFHGDNPALFEVAARLIELLYQVPPLGPEARRLFGDHYGSEILKLLIKEAKEKKEAFHSLHDLIPQEHYALFYKMVRGTRNYTLGKEGIAPLGDFFTLSGEGKPIHYPRVHPLILEALFGKVIKDQLLEEERRKDTTNPASLTEKEYEEFRQRHPEASFLFARCASLINFNPTKKVEREIRSRERKGQPKRRQIIH